MNTLQCTDLDYLKSTYFPDTGLLHFDWIGDDLSNDQIIEGADIMIQDIKKNNPIKVINDNTNYAGKFDFEDTINYVNEYWFPQLMGTTVKRYAHVLSEEFGAKLSAAMISKAFNAINSNYNSDLQFMVFKTMDVAKVWLNELDTKS